MNEYVHGYTERESERLNDQANTLENIIHHDSVWTAGSSVLEAGCGVGAQTKIIAAKNPGCKFTSIDISEESIKQAKITAKQLGLNNVEFMQADIFNLPFEKETFDHILICFVLEHLSNPVEVVRKLKAVLKPGGTITLIEGDHDSAYFYPESKEADLAIKCQVELQHQKGGDANIGRKLYPILKEANLSKINVSPRMVYVDDSKPELVEGFTKNTFTAMIEGVAKEAVAKNLIGKSVMEKGIADLYATTEGNGTFCYTFFKGKAIKA